MFCTRVSALSSSFFLALGLVTLPAQASDNPGAHQHGHANLQVAIDNERVDLLLISPAYNLIGFEHRPRNEEQKQRITDAERWANETPLLNTATGKCTLASAAMHIGWDGDHHDHGHNHDHKHHDHDHKHHDHHDKASGHADIEITQALNCPGLSESDRFETGLMARFPELQHLNVQWVGPQGQGATRLSPDNTRFTPNQ